MQTLIKSLAGERGGVFVITDSRRILLAKCLPRIDVFEHSQRVNLLGAKSYSLKTHHSAVLHCAAPETTREIDAGFLQSVSRFEFVGDFQRQGGIFERLTLDNLSPNELDLSGDWEFDILGPYALIQKLLAL